MVAAAIFQVLAPFVRVTSTDILAALSMAAWACASATLGLTVTKVPPACSSEGASTVASWSMSPEAMVVSSMPRPVVPGTTLKSVPLTVTEASLGGTRLESVSSWSLVSRAIGSSLTMTGMVAPPVKVRRVEAALESGSLPRPSAMAKSAITAASGPRPACA